MRFSIITCSYNNLDGVKAAISAVRRQSVREVAPTSLITELGTSSATEPVEEVVPTSLSSKVQNPPLFTIEHLVIDGASTDGTKEWLEEEYSESRLQAVFTEEGSPSAFQKPTFSQSKTTSSNESSCPSCLSETAKETPNRYTLKWISEPDQGLYDALNKGLHMSTGDVIGILHTDDVWEPGVLERVAEAMESSEFRVQSFGDSKILTSDLRPLTSDFDGIYGDLLYVDAEDITKVKRVWKSGSYHKTKWWNGWMPPHPALFVTQELVKRVGTYRLDLGSAADYEWMLRACLVHQADLMHLPNVLVRMRVGGQSNVTAKARLKANASDRKAWEFNNLSPRPWTLWMKPIRKLPQWLLAFFR